MIKFKTASGSNYTIDDANQMWYREPNPNSTGVRTKEGKFTSHSPVTVGESVVLECPPLVEGSLVRVICTTPVVDIE
jgi:hypothetical protein